MFAAGPDDAVVTLQVAAHARWLVDYYPVESVDVLGDGSLLVRLRTGDTAWLRQLVLRLGGAARVLDPPSLAQDIVAATRSALEAYTE